MINKYATMRMQNSHQMYFLYLINTYDIVRKTMNKNSFDIAIKNLWNSSIKFMRKKI